MRASQETGTRIGKATQDEGQTTHQQAAADQPIDQDLATDDEDRPQSLSGGETRMEVGEDLGQNLTAQEAPTQGDSQGPPEGQQGAEAQIRDHQDDADIEPPTQGKGRAEHHLQAGQWGHREGPAEGGGGGQAARIGAAGEGGAQAVAPGWRSAGLGRCHGPVMFRSVPILSKGLSPRLRRPSMPP